MADEKLKTRHSIVMEERETLSATGVIDVISYDDAVILAETQHGVLKILGADLHIHSINPTNGELEVDGEISSISYENSAAKTRQSLLGKLFR
jgi:sporulation protein YabP